LEEKQKRLSEIETEMAANASTEALQEAKDLRDAIQEQQRKSNSFFLLS